MENATCKIICRVRHNGAKTTTVKIYSGLKRVMFSADGNLGGSFFFFFFIVFLFNVYICSFNNWKHFSQCLPTLHKCLRRTVYLITLHEVNMTAFGRLRIRSALMSSDLPGEWGLLYLPCWPAVWNSVKNSTKEKKTWTLLRIVS